MARISELHYSNALANSTGIAEFVEIALGPGESAGDFAIALYNQDGTQFLAIDLDDSDVEVFTPSDTNETIIVLDGPTFGFLLTDPDGSTADNIEAVALVNTATNTVVNFFDIGGGTTEIEAQDGLAVGATSVNLQVETPPNLAQGSLQFNLPDLELVTAEITRGAAGIPCFAAGTLIDTPWGVARVEDLEVGEYVVTRDRGALPVRWTGGRTVAATGELAPIVITAGRFGATRDLVVSPQHRVLVEGPFAELLFGEPEVLVPAKHLVDGDTVYRREGGTVTYVHLLFDGHELVTSNGAVTESFHPSSENIAGLDREIRDEVLAIFPELGRATHPFATCRTVIRGYEARALSRLGTRLG